MDRETLKTYKLERDLPDDCAIAFEELLKKANEQYVLIYEKTKSVKIGEEQYWKFEVHCPEKNFADAYFYVGGLWIVMVLPIWNKRFDKLTKL